MNSCRPQHRAALLNAVSDAEMYRYPNTSEANSNRAGHCPQVTEMLTSKRGTRILFPHCWHATTRGFSAGSRKPARGVRPS